MAAGCIRESKQEEPERVQTETTVFYSLILEVTTYPFCHILFIRCKSLGPAHTLEDYTQSEYQEAGLTGAPSQLPSTCGEGYCPAVRSWNSWARKVHMDHSTMFLAPGLSYTTKREAWPAITLVISYHTWISQHATSLCSNSIQFNEYQVPGGTLPT